MKGTVLLTGANRGIGLALAGQLLRQDYRVIATCREPAGAPELQALAANGAPLDVQPLDLAEESSALALAGHVQKKYGALDILINNAAVFTDRATKSIDDLDFAELTRTLDINLTGTARVTKALWPLLKLSRNPRVVNISSGAGLISTKRNSNYFCYSISKAALNMLTRLLEHEGREHSICVVALTPGRVQTRMGDADAPLTPEETAESIATMIEGLKLSDTGGILDRHGKPCFEGRFTDAAGRVCHVGW